MIWAQKLIEWAEGEVSRGRKIALFSVIFSSIFLTFAVLVASWVPTTNTWMDGFFPYFASFMVLAGTAVGFYCGTKPKVIDTKSGKVQFEEQSD